jgi:homoaconitase/3-isopropylmalate dehydratase large subunit
MVTAMQMVPSCWVCLSIGIVYGAKQRLKMTDEKQYEVVNGSKFGDLRREREKLMKKLVQDNDASVKPRIRELTLEMTEYLSSRKRNT